MAYSPYDADPDSAPDVRCSCGAVVTQTIYYACQACSKQFEVACTPKGFWGWVRITGEPVCSHCGVLADRVQWLPGRLHRVCQKCGADEVIAQGI